jgi:hypothetical protein
LWKKHNSCFALCCVSNTQIWKETAYYSEIRSLLESNLVEQFLRISTKTQDGIQWKKVKTWKLLEFFLSIILGIKFVPNNKPKIKQNESGVQKQFWVSERLWRDLLQLLNHDFTGHKGHRGVLEGSGSAQKPLD